MKKLLFLIVTFLFLCNGTTLLAQKKLLANTESVRTSVDGPSTDYFYIKRKKSKKLDLRSAFGGVQFTSLNAQRTNFYGLTYNLAYPLKKLGDNTLCIAINPSFGGSMSADSKMGNNYVYGIDMPLVTEIHFGKKEEFGGIVGLGMSYNYITTSEQNYPHTSIGPVVEAGIRFKISDRTILLKACFELNTIKKTVGSEINTYTSSNVFGATAAFVF